MTPTRAELVEGLELEPLTELSITDRGAFREEIDLVRRRGYATMDEENELGMRAVAVPVFNSQGIAFASLATAVPVFRMSMEALVALVPAAAGRRCGAVRPASPAVGTAADPFMNCSLVEQRA